MIKSRSGPHAMAISQRSYLLIVIGSLVVMSIVLAVVWRYPSNRVFNNLRPSAKLATQTGIWQVPQKACKATAYRSWKKGIVTLLEPEVSKNCSALFQGNQEEIHRVAEVNKRWDHSRYNKKFSEWIDSEDCQKIKIEFEENFYISGEEWSFPLAFAMNVHSNPQQIIRLLRVIYRPHNLYCIHYDQKTSDAVKKVFNTLAKCLKNVIIPKKIVRVVYGCYPILEAQLSCMSDLFEARSVFPWKYLTTICGKEVPLSTNREIVNMLSKLNGIPSLYEHTYRSGELSHRISTKWLIKSNVCVRTNEPYSNTVPHGLEIRKSMAYFSLTPEFTDYILHSKIATDLYKYLHFSANTEESFYGTLFHYWMNGMFI